jgi:hypothetical protein
MDVDITDTTENRTTRRSEDRMAEGTEGKRSGARVYARPGRLKGKSTMILLVLVLLVAVVLLVAL